MRIICGLGSYCDTGCVFTRRYGWDIVSRMALQSMSLDQTQPRPVTKSVGQSVDWLQTVNDQLEEEAIMQISGASLWVKLIGSTRVYTGAT